MRCLPVMQSPYSYPFCQLEMQLLLLEPSPLNRWYRIPRGWGGQVSSPRRWCSNLNLCTSCICLTFMPLRLRAPEGAASM